MDAYRQTIHKPLPKEEIRVPEAKLQASTDAASEQFKKLKMANVSTKDEVRGYNLMGVYKQITFSK